MKAIIKHIKAPIVIIILLACCNNVKTQSNPILYSFFSAGHAYGNPMNVHYGLHYPFVDYIPTINNHPTMELGFLTGDVVYTPNKTYWDSAQVDINKIAVPTYIAAGNHDVSQEFVERFGEYHHSFVHKNDLHIVLKPKKTNWNIEGEQLNFLKKTLDSNHANVNNIFIFLHELIWWSPTNEYKDININYRPHYPGTTNYESTIKPLLKSYPNNITVFAGDLGATKPVSAFMYDQFDNITLIGSGMGSGSKDNIIITDVYADTVIHNLVAINGSDPNALGSLHDYAITTNSLTPTAKETIIYPNPTQDGFFYIKNENFDKIELFDSLGKVVLTQEIKQKSLVKINTSNLHPGLYMAKLFTKEHNKMIEVIIR